MFRRSILVLLPACVAAVGLTPAANAGIKVYEDGDKFIEIGGRIQLQYLYTDDQPKDGPSESADTVFFRRLRPYISGSVTKNWMGKIQFDFGKSIDQDEVAVKDAYMMYSGWKNTKIYIGNTKTPFSRQFLTSSKRQQTIERFFVGDHNLGSPDRQLGLRVDGHTESKKFGYKLAFGSESHDPDIRRIDFDTPVNDLADWNEGWIYAARIDFFPWGPMKFDQGDFARDAIKANFSLAAFGWDNDNDRNTHTDENKMCTSSSKCDLDSSTGWEVSAGIRGRGLSADLEFNEVDGDLIDNQFNGGVYLNGETTIEKWVVKVGYMLEPIPLELVYQADSLDADGYADAWTSNNVALNYFFNKHKAKVQFLYRMSSDVQGVSGDDRDTFIMQWQFVF